MRNRLQPQWTLHTLIRLIQVLTVSGMLLISVDWALGDGTHRAWLAVLSVVLTLLQILDERHRE